MHGMIKMFSSSRAISIHESVMHTWAPVYKFSSDFVQLNARDVIVNGLQDESNYRATYWDAEGILRKTIPESKRPVICSIPIHNNISQSVLGKAVYQLSVLRYFFLPEIF